MSLRFDREAVSMSSYLGLFGVKLIKPLRVRKMCDRSENWLAQGI